MSFSRIIVLEIGRFLYFVGSVSLVYLVGLFFGVVSLGPFLVSAVLFLATVFYVVEFVWDMVV